MRTPILEPFSYKGWTIQLYLEDYGFSFKVVSPSSMPMEHFETSEIYTDVLQARLAAKKFVKFERAAFSLGMWLIEMYMEDNISAEEYEALYSSIHDVYVTEGGKL